MESLAHLLNGCEIQLIVLVSLTLQIFLFFTGGLRRRSTNALLRFSMWIAYLGADLVAMYAIGFLSRHKQDDTTTGKETLREEHPLAFLWAPFLLMHLGGQDTVTAFAIEDNNLWLRHLLNLIVQVVLALYVFWESTKHKNAQILDSGIFVFIAGIIKYGERTVALMFGNQKSIGSVTVSEEKEDLPKLNQLNVDGHFNTLHCALIMAPAIREIFAGRTSHQMERTHLQVLVDYEEIVMDNFPKFLEIELDLMYHDIYTKAIVLRTRSGIILRCVSQVSMVVAFMLFILNNKHRYYNKADLAITYVLFTGSFFVELCAVLMFMMSPWTWLWLEAQECCKLTRISTFLLRYIIGRAERRPLWSNSMGQYNFQSYVGSRQSRLFKIVQMVGAGKGNSVLWMSKLLDTKYLQVDKEIMDSVVRMINEYNPNELRPDFDQNLVQRWPKLGPVLHTLLPEFDQSFGNAIVLFHLFTEVHLSEYPPNQAPVGACRKLSNYLLYLLVTQPEMLPVNGSTEQTLLFFLDNIAQGKHSLNSADERLYELGLQNRPSACSEILEEIRDFWTTLLIYSAGQSRPELHAAQLCRGGELLTFAWLLMAHIGLGDVADHAPLKWSEIRRRISDH